MYLDYLRLNFFYPLPDLFNKYELVYKCNQTIVTSQVLFPFFHMANKNHII